MKITKTRGRLLLATLLTVLASSPATAQEGQGQDEGDERFRPRLDDVLEPQSPQDELTQLFRDVELRLRQIDELLDNASTGDTSGLAEVGESGIDKLLRRSMEGGQQVVRDIDRILEIAAQNGGT